MNNQTFKKIHPVILFVLLTCITTVFSQNNAYIIDTTYLKCEYKTNYYTDTLAMENGIWMNDEFILQVGTNTSKYFSKLTDAYERVKADSKAWKVYQEYFPDKE